MRFCCSHQGGVRLRREFAQECPQHHDRLYAFSFHIRRHRRPAV